MTDKKKQAKDYLIQNVNIFIQPMIYDIMKKKPKDAHSHAVKWLTQYINKRKAQDSDLDSENQDVVEELVFNIQKLAQNQIEKNQKGRKGISSEVFGSFNRRDSLQIKRVPKSEQTKLLILGLIRNSILFQNIDYQDEAFLIQAMEQKITTEGESIIKEGQKGGTLFIVESGQYNCYKMIEGENKYLKTYTHGDAFGELSLMYNAPRAATIIVKIPGKIYSLDRITFGSIAQNATTKKRKLYKKVIDQIQIFSNFSEHEKEQLFDVLKQEKYEPNQYIIRQGQNGNKFYIIIEGKLVAEKNQPDNQFPKIVYKYSEGEYFGELSLLHDVNRQASVKAVTRVRVASINRDSFKRMLGNLEDILKRNQVRYMNQQEQLQAS